MKKSRTTGQLGLLAFAMAAGPALAQVQAYTPSWYGGFSFGQSAATIDDERIVRGLAAGRLTTTGISEDDRDTGYKIFFGRQLTRYLAVEAGAFDLGEFGFTATTIPTGTFSGRIKVRGVNLDLVGTLPLSERFSAFGRVGVQHAEAKDSFTSTGLVRVLNANPSKRDTNYKAGLGIQYAFSNALSLRAEVERYRIDDAVGNKGDIDLASIGIIYRFGGSPPPPIQRASAPEPVQQAPRVSAPEPAMPPPVAVRPAPVAPPPPPPPMRVKFAADALFDFDKATLKPAGKQALDKFAADLRGVAIDAITITGHTDRIGSAAYNEKLSARRAEAVRAYLVDTARLPAGKFTTRGAGESAPETKPGQCKGNTPTKPLVACLQPDRRVEVEVTGTRP